MPEISKKYIPAHKGDKNPNPKLMKFVTKVTDRIILPVTFVYPFYFISYTFALKSADALSPL